MGDIVRRLKRIFQSVLGMDLFEQEDQPSEFSTIDNLKSDLAGLRTAAARVIANQYRIERLLSLERKKQEEITAEIELAEFDQELQDSLSLRKELSRSKVSDLEDQLESAKRQSSQARLQLEQFQKQLDDLANTIRDSQIRYQLANMKTQMEKFALTGSREKDLLAIERIKERADIAQAEAEAIAELKEALELPETDRGR